MPLVRLPEHQPIPHEAAERVDEPEYLVAHIQCLVHQWVRQTPQVDHDPQPERVLEPAQNARDTTRQGQDFVEESEQHSEKHAHDELRPDEVPSVELLGLELALGSHLRSIDHPRRDSTDNEEAHTHDETSEHTDHDSLPDSHGSLPIRKGSASHCRLECGLTFGITGFKKPQLFKIRVHPIVIRIITIFYCTYHVMVIVVFLYIFYTRKKVV